MFYRPAPSGSTPEVGHTRQEGDGGQQAATRVRGARQVCCCWEVRLDMEVSLDNGLIVGPGQCLAVSQRSLEKVSWEDYWSVSAGERKSQWGQTHHRQLMSLSSFESLHCRLGRSTFGNNEVAQRMYGYVFIELIAKIRSSIDVNLNKSLY